MFIDTDCLELQLQFARQHLQRFIPSIQEVGVSLCPSLFHLKNRKTAEFLMETQNDKQEHSARARLLSSHGHGIIISLWFDTGRRWRLCASERRRTERQWACRRQPVDDGAPGGEAHEGGHGLRHAVPPGQGPLPHAHLPRHRHLHRHEPLRPGRGCPVQRPHMLQRRRAQLTWRVRDDRTVRRRDQRSRPRRLIRQGRRLRFQPAMRRSF